MKTVGKRALSLLLALVMCLSLLPITAAAAEGETNLAVWANTLVTDATNGSGKMPIPIAAISGNKKDGAELTRGGAGAPTGENPAINSTKSNQTVWFNNWTANDSYWQLKFSTTGITENSLVVRAGQYSTSNGPKHFQAKYSLTGNDNDFTPVGAPYPVGTSKSSTPALNITLPDELKDKATVYIRLYPTDGTLGSNNNSRIHDIYVVNAATPTQVATPTTNLNVGSTVPVGTKVTIACEQGASLKIKVGAAAEWSDFDGTITLGTVGSYTATVKAVKTGLDDSEELTLNYTVTAPQTPLANNSEVVIYYPTGPLALTATADGKKLTGVTGIVAENKLTTTNSAVVFTAQLGADNFYRFSSDGKYLTTEATGNSLSLSSTETDYSLWTLEATTDGYFIRSVHALSNGKPQYLEYYNGFTTYGMGNNTAIYTFQFFAKENVVFNSEPEPGPGPDPDDPTPATLPTTGDYVIWVGSEYNQALSSNMNDKGYVLGQAVTASEEGILSGPTQTEVWTVTRTDTTSSTEQGTYTLQQGDKFLGVNANGYLTVDTAPSGKDWTIEVNGSHLYMKCNTGGKYLEWYAQYNDWSLYGTSQPTGNALYQLTFTPANQVLLPEISTYEADPDVEQSIAAWGGSTSEYDSLENKNAIQGDLYKSSDMRDANAIFTVLANGAPAQAYQRTSTQSGGYNYYMGGANIGKAAGDYMQFSVSTAGYADMTLSFRLRATNAAPGSFQLQYSNDGGATFKPFSTGSYSYAYTAYFQGVPQDVKGSGSITDGVAQTSVAAGEYVTFTFDVPAGAENGQNVLIRLLAGSTRADGDTEKAISGNIRIDSVVLSGHPIVGDDFTSYVTVTPDNEEDQAAGTELTLSCATAGAEISYRFVNPDTGAVVSDWATYSDSAKPTLPSPLPVVLEAKATAADKADSITRMWVYAAGTVSAVKMSPNGGGVYFGDKNSIPVTLTCDTEDAVIHYSINSEDPEAYQVYDPNTPINLNKENFTTTTIRAYATKQGFTDSPIITRTFTLRENAEYSLYFGQLHSHTSFSDGAGTCDDAFKHAKNLADSWNIDFLAVTDHSNSFDNADSADSASLADGSMSTEWTQGHTLADQYTGDGFTGIYGFEMTWSNGLGHINTFNTPGFQSRTQKEYSSYNTALQNYYTTLKTQSNSISQFNHPGTTFGDFSDFAHYDEEIDNLITTIEVGNGEGAVGSSGYFPSYEYYTRALDKGWHVAPTNNQDNHKGNWGDSNTGRTVVLADSLARDDIYDALRNYRVYATEDLNLEIRYTLDGSLMGTILDGASGQTAKAKVVLNDPDDAGEATIQVIVNGGLVANETKATCNGTVELEVPTTYSYYYIKVIQADGNIAVTAPVWLGKVEAVGVGSMTAASDLTVVGQEQTINLELYNNENKALEVTSIVFTDKATGTVLHTDTSVTSVSKLGTASCSFTHTFTQDGIVTIVATVNGTLNGVTKTYTKELELTVMPAEIVRTVIVDGTHFNDYVTGYYGGNMHNMTSIAADVGVQVKVVTDKITAEMLETCALLVISAPARTTGTANAGDFTPSEFEPEFITLVQNYVAAGGSVAVCGLADYQDKKAADADHHAAAQLNKLLTAIGSSMRINDDEVYDTVNNGGQPYRLYPESFNAESKWTKGIVTKDSVAEGANYQKYSQYSGCSVNPGNGTWLVKGFDTTLSVDSDKDGVGATTEDFVDGEYSYKVVTPKGQVTFLAAETVGSGTVFAAGGVFLSDFEVKAELDNIWDLPYANRTIFENILAAVREDVEPTPIAEIRKAEKNKVFVAEGYVTNGTQNENTKFFDAIYVQDETGGITVFPYSTMGLEIGTKVQIIGYTDAYQGDKEIQIISLQVLDAEPKIYEPKALTTEQAADYETYGGQLVSTQGVVSDIVKDGGVVSQFKLTDSTGVAATIFIDGYITNSNGQNTIGNWIKNGDTVSAAGLSYLHPEGDSDVSVCVLRVRNCDEIKLISAAPGSTTPTAPSTTVVENDDGSVTTTVTDPATGTVTETTERTDGSVVESVTDRQGNVELTVTAESGEVVASVQLPAQLPTAPSTFVDVPDDHWAADSINTLAAMGMVYGQGDDTYGMTDAMTRGGLVSILYRFSNGQAGAASSFTDVPSDAWYAEAVAWASRNGVVNGYPDNVYAPNQEVTREQMASILYRYAKLLGLDVTVRSTDLSTAFNDGSVTAGWAQTAMAWCVERGIIQGKGSRTLDPTASTTRAESAVMLQRLINLMH